MKNGKNKYNAMLLALCMVLTTFVAVVSIPVGADVNFGDNDWRANFNDAWMIEPEDEIIFNFDANTGVYYTLGANGLQVDVVLVNLNSLTELDNVEARLTSTDAVFDITDGIDSPPGGPFTVGFTWTADFTIDIWGDRGVTPLLGVHNLLLTLEYDIDPDDSETMRDLGHTDSIPIKLIITSIFQAPNPNAADPRDDPIYDDAMTGAPVNEVNLVVDETFGDAPLEAGEEFQEGRIDMTNYATDPITFLETNLTRPTNPDSITNGIEERDRNAKVPQGIGAGGNGMVTYRLDVDPLVDPGVYPGLLEIHYTRNGKRCHETPTTLDFVVDFTPVIQASATVSTIDQGDKNVTMTVTFNNVGNVPLSELFVRVSEQSVSDGTNNEYLFTALDHYEGTTVKVTEWFAVAVGGSVTIVKGLDSYIPAGPHKVLFEWHAYYYNTGVLGDATEYQHVVQIWEPKPEEDGTGVPHEAAMWKDEPGNGLYPGTGLGGPDSLDGRPWQMGTYVNVNVIDDELSIYGRIWNGIPVNAGEADVTYRGVVYTITNQENVDLIDVHVTLEVGPGTPFLDPTNPAATTLDMDPISPTVIPADQSRDFVFFVDVNSGWFTETAVDPGVFVLDLTVQGTNGDTLEEYAPRVLEVDTPVNGFGPELFGSLVSTTKITPGESFELTVTITNYGQDVAREIDAYLRADFVNGWEIVDRFTSSISSFGEETVNDGSYFSYNWSRGNNIRPGEIGVDNVPQIVELHDWITRRETPPQGVILWLHFDRLDPGQQMDVVFNMISDVNMVEGMVYYETLELYYVDSINGDTYGPDGPPVQTHYTPPQEVLIRTGKGEKFDADAVDFSVVLYAIIFLIIAFIVFLIGYALGGRGGGRAREEPAPFEDYEQEYVPPPDEDMPMDDEPEEEELGPPPVPEEDIKPPE